MALLFVHLHLILLLLLAAFAGALAWEWIEDDNLCWLVSWTAFVAFLAALPLALLV